MDFLGMGSGEIVLILVIALIVLGPGKIVGVARGLGKLSYNFKKVTTELTTQITREIQEQEKTISESAAQAATEIKKQVISSTEEPKQIVNEVRDIETDLKNDKPFSENRNL